MNPILCANGITYRYINNSHGLDDISLDVRPGEAVWIAGPSGCGKSTLARCLTGLIPHLYRGQLAGQIWVDGLRTAETPLWQLAERAGLVLQNPAAQMLTTSVEEEIVFGLENLGLSRADIGERLESALVRFGLQELRGRSPQTLSGGEQQKLALAATMARQPAALVLDEPLSMLDSTASAGLVAHLAELADAGAAVVICEHHSEPLRQMPALRTIQLTGPTRNDDQIARPAAGWLATDWPVARLPSFNLVVSSLSVNLGGRPVLQNLGFAVPGGQIVVVVGRNGVGKTTLLRTLAGLQPHTGQVAVDGRPPELALVFQNPDLQLFNATVREEILYRLPNPDMARYAWLIEMLGLAPYERTPPLLLSEGEKKRLALAIALMRGLRHGVLLDEPSLGQDAMHKKRLMRLARALADAGQVVIMTTHDLALAAHADRVLLLSQEGIVADGPPGGVFHDQAAWARAGLLLPDWMHDVEIRRETAHNPG